MAEPKRHDPVSSSQPEARDGIDAFDADGDDGPRADEVDHMRGIGLFVFGSSFTHLFYLNHIIPKDRYLILVGALLGLGFIWHSFRIAKVRDSIIEMRCDNISSIVNTEHEDSNRPAGAVD